jgi:hypothetical protein
MPLLDELHRIGRSKPPPLNEWQQAVRSKPIPRAVLRKLVGVWRINWLNVGKTGWMKCVWAAKVPVSKKAGKSPLLVARMVSLNVVKLGANIYDVFTRYG